MRRFWLGIFGACAGIVIAYVGDATIMIWDGVVVGLCLSLALQEMKKT
jgi:hypothetical protein